MTKAVAAVSISSALLGTAALLVLSILIGQQKNENIGLYFLYQAISLCISGFVVLVIWLAKGRKLDYLQLGTFRAPASEIHVLGIKSTESWRKVGITFAVAISIATAVFLAVAYQSKFEGISTTSWLTAFMLAIPLSIVNAFNEEVITRWSIAEGLSGSLASWAPWVSALIFGSVHFFGIPDGPIGSIMAAFLAWLLTKSIQDTRGIGWAWGIHVLQDILILTVTLAIFL